MTTPSDLPPALEPIPNGCFCRLTDGTIGPVWPEASCDAYRMDVGGSWRYGIRRADLVALTAADYAEYERRCIAASKVRRAIASMRSAPSFAKPSLFERAEIAASFAVVVEGGLS